MEVSFLVCGNEAFESISKSLPDGAEGSIREFSKSNDFRIATFSAEGESLGLAKRLAQVRDEFSSIDTEARLLDDDPSKRFERDLFEEIAAFERGLRKVILLSACPEDRDLRSVEELEQLDFGRLFEMLFVDSEFNKEMKSLIGGKGRLFEKRELLEKVRGIKEDSIWNRYFGERGDADAA